MCTESSKKQLKSSFSYPFSQLFRPSLLKKIHDPVEENNIKTLIEACDSYHDDGSWNLVKGLEFAYNYLKINYKCEYIYKNEIANQLLLNRHGDNSATLLKELVSDSSIADIVIINGHTTAYEIKTELDSFERLSNQVESYRCIYDYSYIVTYPAAQKIVSKKIDADIGIILFDADGVLKIVRKASDNTNLFDPKKAVLTLRQSELVTAYEKYVTKLPVMGTALIHNFCRRWYLALDKADAKIIFSEALKSRKPASHQFELVKQCSPAMKILFLGKDLSKKYSTQTINKLCIFD